MANPIPEITKNSATLSPIWNHIAILLGMYKSQNKTTTKFFHRLKNVEVRMINTSGIFFIAVLKQISAGKIPPLVFIWSYSDRVIIRPRL